MNYRNHIALNLATAHPHYDEEGNTYNMGTALIGLGRPKYVIFKIPAETSGMRANRGGEGIQHDLDLRIGMRQKSEPNWNLHSGSLRHSRTMQHNSELYWFLCFLWFYVCYNPPGWDYECAQFSNWWKTVIKWKEMWFGPYDDPWTLDLFLYVSRNI